MKVKIMNIIKNFEKYESKNNEYKIKEQTVNTTI